MRMAEALTLRSAGANYREIAEQLGVSVSVAFEDVREAIRRTIPADVGQEQLALELDRLDRLQRTYYLRALGFRDANGVQHDPDLEAARFCLTVIDQRAKMLGLHKVVLDIRSSGDELPDSPLENLRRIHARVKERLALQSGKVIDVSSSA